MRIPLRVSLMECLLLRRMSFSLFLSWGRLAKSTFGAGRATAAGVAASLRAELHLSRVELFRPDSHALLLDRELSVALLFLLFERVLLARAGGT